MTVTKAATSTIGRGFRSRLSDAKRWAEHRECGESMWSCELGSANPVSAAMAHKPSDSTKTEVTYSNGGMSSTHAQSHPRRKRCRRFCPRLTEEAEPLMRWRL